MAMISQACK